MNDDTKRYLAGGGFAGIAATLLYLGEPVWSLFPATAAVYILGSLLYERLF